MANTKTKLFIAVIVVAVVIGMAASAGASPALAKKPEEDDDDDAATDEEITVDMPGPSPDGAPGEGPEIVVEEVLPEGEEDEELQMSIPAPPPVSSSTSQAPQEPIVEEVAPPPSMASDAGRERMEAASQAPLSPVAPTLLDTAVERDAVQSGQPVSQVIQAVAKDIVGTTNPTPLAQQELSQEADPHGTLALARTLISRENLPGWKEDLRGDVAEWQKSLGLKDDGMFGPTSLAKMAEEAGLLPLVRYWPKSVTTRDQARAAMTAKLAPVLMELQKYLPMSEQHIAGIKASMRRENAPTLGTNNPPPQKSLEWVRATTEAIGQAAEAEGEDEISA